MLRIRLLKILLLLGSLTLTFAVAEVFLRIAGIGLPNFSGPDPISGAWHLPGAEGMYRLEGEAWISINSQGLRDREHEFSKPSDSFRIAILGDSYAEALQVDYKDTFWSVMSEDLAACPALTGRKVETINFGVSGFGTAQELRVLRHRAWAYQPDFVLLAFVHNDVRNNLRALEGDEVRPYFVLRDGELDLDASFITSDQYVKRTSLLRTIRRQLGVHFRVVQLFNELTSILLRRRAAASSIPISDHIYGPPRNDDWTEAWAVTDALLRQVATETMAGGAGFLLVGITDNHQVPPDPSVREKILAEGPATDLDYPEKRLAAVASRRGFQFLPLVEPFRQHAEENQVCLHGFENRVPCGGHWNERGHRLGGKMMATAVCAQLQDRADFDAVEDLAR